MRLDHLAITCADLASGTCWAEQALGVTFGPGGRHERFGTHNRLIGLADGLYLEVIAPNPEATIRGPRWFGLDTPPATPTLGNWIVATDDIASATAAFGEVVPLERDGLTWQMRVPRDGSLPADGGLPTLIEWGRGVRTPGESLPPSGLRLERLEIHHPDAGTLATEIAAPCESIWRAAPLVTLRARFDTPKGPVWLG